MIRHFDVKHISIQGFDRVFTWDDQTGEISGRDAAKIIPVLAQAKVDGQYVNSGQISVRIRDPFRNLGELALIAFEGFPLPPDLADAVAALPWPKYHYREDVVY